MQETSLLYDHFMCLTLPNFTKAKFHGKILLHSCFSMVKGSQNWRPHEWRPQGRHYIGLDGLKLNYVHNFPTKQHFSMKFWILVTFMLKGSHATILVNFDQNLARFDQNLTQNFVKIVSLKSSGLKSVFCHQGQYNGGLVAFSSGSLLPC